MERYGAIVLPPNDAPEVALRPTWRRSDPQARLAPAGAATFSVTSISTSLSDGLRTVEDRTHSSNMATSCETRSFDYRRALHRHDVDHFVRTYDVATHQHCEATMGRPLCGHYSGLPVNGAIDGFRRLYTEWVAGTRPDCSRLICLD